MAVPGSAAAPNGDARAKLRDVTIRHVLRDVTRDGVFKTPGAPPFHPRRLTGKGGGGLKVNSEQSSKQTILNILWTGLFRSGVSSLQPRHRYRKSSGSGPPRSRRPRLETEGRWWSTGRLRTWEWCCWQNHTAANEWLTGVWVLVPWDGVWWWAMQGQGLAMIDASSIRTDYPTAATACNGLPSRPVAYWPLESLIGLAQSHLQVLILQSQPFQRDTPS